MNFIHRFPVSQPARAAGFAILMAVFAACSRGQTSMTAPSDPEATLRRFMNAIKANSLTAMAELWGTSKGPAARTMKPDEMDKRLTVIKSYLVHDKFEFQPSQTLSSMGNDLRVLEVRLTRGPCTPVVPFTMVRWGDGWLVQSIDLSAAGTPGRPCVSGAG